MKKLFFILAVLLTVMSSCRKDMTTTDTSQNEISKVMQTPSKEDMNLLKNGDPAFTFEKLDAKYTLENGILHFQKADDLSKMTMFLQKAMPSEIEKWEKSLVGFRSVFRNYVNAKKELMATEDIEQIKAKYQGKIKVDSDNEIKPMINIGKTFGSLITEEGLFKVENVLVAYYNDQHISMIDGDMQTFNYVKNNLRTDVAKKIYVHAVQLELEKPSQLQLRGICSSSCGTQHQQTIRNGNFRLRNAYFYEDHSVIFTSSILAKVGFHIDVDNERKKLLVWVGDGSGFNWGFGWGVEVLSTLGSKGATGGSRFGLSQGGWTWNTNQAFLNVDIFLVNEEWTLANGLTQSDLIATAQQSKPFLLRSCLGRTGLVSSTNSTNVQNTQFCWSDTSM